MMIMITTMKNLIMIPEGGPQSRHGAAVVSSQRLAHNPGATQRLSRRRGRSTTQARRSSFVLGQSGFRPAS
eukprot:540948-Pyramimonas_sp.AAC.1